MSWSVEWSPPALRDFYALPQWTTAARIDEALLRLAESGDGALRRVVIDGVTMTVLLVPPYSVVLSRDKPRRTILVWRIVRYA
jgi:hypothetical protein